MRSLISLLGVLICWSAYSQELCIEKEISSDCEDQIKKFVGNAHWHSTRGWYYRTLYDMSEHPIRWEINSSRITEFIGGGFNELEEELDIGDYTLSNDCSKLYINNFKMTNGSQDFGLVEFEIIKLNSQEFAIYNNTFCPDTCQFRSGPTFEFGNKWGEMYSGLAMNLYDCDDASNGYCDCEIFTHGADCSQGYKISDNVFDFKLQNKGYVYMWDMFVVYSEGGIETFHKNGAENWSYNFASVSNGTFNQIPFERRLMDPILFKNDKIYVIGKYNGDNYDLVSINKFGEEEIISQTDYSGLIVSINENKNQITLLNGTSLKTFDYIQNSVIWEFDLELGPHPSKDEYYFAQFRDNKLYLGRRNWEEEIDLEIIKVDTSLNQIEERITINGTVFSWSDSEREDYTKSFTFFDDYIYMCHPENTSEVVLDYDLNLRYHRVYPNLKFTPVIKNIFQTESENLAIHYTEDYIIGNTTQNFYFKSYLKEMTPQGKILYNHVLGESFLDGFKTSTCLVRESEDFDGYVYLENGDEDLEYTLERSAMYKQISCPNTLSTSASINNTENKIHVFPNPNNGILNISGPFDSAKLFTIQGLWLMDLADSNDLSHLLGGAYLIIIELANGEHMIKKLIKI